MEKTFIELFAGVGGFRVGLEKAGFRCKWFNQWEPNDDKQRAFSVYREHFKDVLRGDENKPIQDVNKASIPDASLLVGGFPCQDYSTLNAKRGGLAGDKGALWFSILDVLDAKRPPFCLFENVPAIRTVNGGKDFEFVLRSLADRGYNFETAVLNSADFGLSQRRKRLFFFCWRNDTRFFNDYGWGFFAGLKRSAETVPLRSILLPWLESREIPADRIEKLKYWKGAKTIVRTRKDGSTYEYKEGGTPFPDDLDKPGRTITGQEALYRRATHVVQDLETGKLRTLDPIETERMQGFSDNWTLGLTDRWRFKCMGNAVSVNVIHAIGDAIATIIDKEGGPDAN